jgi:hypothetical protein
LFQNLTQTIAQSLAVVGTQVWTVPTIGSLLVIIVLGYMWFEVHQTINQAGNLIGDITNMKSLGSLASKVIIHAISFTAWFYMDVLAFLGLIISTAKMSRLYFFTLL